jgi:hypothetical protein
MCSLLGGGLTNLDAEAREIAVDRAGILDVTYLGRFTGIPNGALTGGRVDPSFCTRGERRRARRVVSAIHRIVRLVIGQMNSSVEAIVVSLECASVYDGFVFNSHGFGRFSRVGCA